MHFNQYKNLIYKQAWRYARNYNLDSGDLISEGYLIFEEAKNRFNPNIGIKFSTFLTHRLRALNDYCHKEITFEHRFMSDSKQITANSISTIKGKYYKKYIHSMVKYDKVFCLSKSIPATYTGLPTSDKEDLEELSSLLSRDGKTIVSAIIQGIFDIINPIRQTLPTFYRIYKMIRKIWGWERQRIIDVWEEVKLKWTFVTA